MDNEEKPLTSAEVEEPSPGELVKEIAADLSSLIRMEVDLAKTEISELVKSKLRGLGLVIVGGALALLILPLIVLTSIEVLAIWLPRWGASLVVAGAVGLFAAATFVLARKQLVMKFVPENTIRSIKEDVEWAKSLKRDREK